LVGVTLAICKLSHWIFKTVVSQCFEMGDKTGFVRPGHIQWSINCITDCFKLLSSSLKIYEHFCTFSWLTRSWWANQVHLLTLFIICLYFLSSCLHHTCTIITEWIIIIWITVYWKCLQLLILAIIFWLCYSYSCILIVVSV